MPGSDSRTALAAGLTAVVLWGASFIAIKIALLELAPVNLVWLRFAMGTAVLAVAAASRGELATLPPREMAMLALLGLQGITFHQWLQATALLSAEAATSGWIVASAPVFIAVLSRLLLGERLAALQTVGIIVAFAGVVVVVTRADPARLLAAGPTTSGDLLITLSAANWAVFSVLSRGLLRRLSPVRSMLWVMTAGWLGSSLLLPTGPGLVEIAGLSARAWAATAFLGVLCSGLAYVLWYDALHHAPAARVGVLLYLEPLVAQLVAVAVLGEPVTTATLGGGAAILLGVHLVSRRRAGTGSTLHYGSDKEGER